VERRRHSLTVLLAREDVGGSLTPELARNDADPVEPERVVVWTVRALRIHRVLNLDAHLALGEASVPDRLLQTLGVLHTSGRLVWEDTHQNGELAAELTH